MSGILNLLLGSAAGVIKDAYFNLVTLLLNTTATNGAQNNTFLDSSTNNFSITRNGNATQGTFTPFSQTGWSNYLASNSAVGLTLPSGGFGSGDFTLEYWFYPTSLYDYITVFSTTRGGGGFNVGTDSAGLLVWYSGGARQIAAGTILPNRWHHAAFVRSGSTLTGYLNGTSVGTATVTTNFSTTGANIGSLDAGSEFISGYVSNLRAVVGTAVYTSNFTPSTTPLTAVTNTKLLTCQSNRFVDNSASPLTLTFTNGSPSVQAFSPFVPTDAYSTSVVGGSGYFDGSGDYLSFQDTTQSGSTSNFDMGAVNASWDFWAYITTTSASLAFAKTANAVSSWNDIQYIFYPYESGSTTFFFRNGANYALIQGTFPAKLNAWAHFVVSTDTSNNISIYVNGTRLTTTNNTIGKPSTANYIGIGSQAGAPSGGVMNGYISGMRFISGANAFSASASTITVPTTPPTAVSGTQLLLNYTNAGIYDAAAKNNLETVGNAQVSTTQAKFGTTSMYFGTSGTNKLYTTSIIPQQSGNFTLEMWLYPTSFADYNTIFDSRTSDGDANGFVLGLNSAAKLYFYTNSAFALTTTGTISANTWTHVALVRNGTGSGNIKIYVNGTADATTATNTASFTRTSASIGDDWGTRSNLQYFGYADDIRISNFARYTATFTPPAAAFPIQ